MELAARTARIAVSPTMKPKREPESLAAHLPIGSPEHCARVLSDYAAAGVDTVLLWPRRDPLQQLDLVADRVRPLVVG